jgi:VIT1/CCC1 family predicted Fe2+/Mn2+ transporter
MKKVINKKMQTALLKGAVMLVGSVCILTAALFIDDVYGAIATIMVGSGLILLINSSIK